jgi:thiol:disulfide interchange protein DsbD
MNQPGDFTYLQAFLGGIAVSFTPCVYPLIPVTASFIGTHTAGSKFKGLSLSLVYVTGIAIIYSLLGVIASLTGTIFGRVSSHPITNIIVGLIIMIFGISMLGVFHMHLAHGKQIVHKKHDFLSTFVLGLSSGLIASSCLTPVLGSILIYIATKKNIFYGATLLLTFAYGMGFVLIIIGTFEGLLVNMPKAGKWMEYIKKIGAVILILTGIYFIITGIRRM